MSSALIAGVIGRSDVGRPNHVRASEDASLRNRPIVDHRECVVRPAVDPAQVIEQLLQLAVATDERNHDVDGGMTHCHN